ncbi:peptidase S8/S53 domain-containing protein [Flagelloscypha sp. PMI_526]|nr:peptidase S8/S53 domain-containing protein [Flagelloscypha sp. PMI_526]
MSFHTEPRLHSYSYFGDSWHSYCYVDFLFRSTHSFKDLYKPWCSAFSISTSRFLYSKMIHSTFASAALLFAGLYHGIAVSATGSGVVAVPEGFTAVTPFEFMSLAPLPEPTGRAVQPRAAHEIVTVEGAKSDRLIVIYKDSIQAFDTTGIQPVHKLDSMKMVVVNNTADNVAKLVNDPTIDSIHEDALIKPFDTQAGATWGLQRISGDKIPGGSSPYGLTFQYTYQQQLGSGVDIYIIDTGIRTTHQLFEGRASWGFVANGLSQRDEYGHGTHCAGTAAALRVGVAQKAKLIAVKVFNDDEGGHTSEILAGMNYVSGAAAKSGRPSVASMSLGGDANKPLDDAVKALTDKGIHVVAAAGNDGKDANTVSPARAPSAITVGATAINDTFADFSNYGSALDILAPGVDVPSTWSTSDTAGAILSGTSMAAPHVSGLVAYFISLMGNKSPADMAQLLKSKGQSGKISKIMAFLLPEGSTVNLLAHNA